MENNNFTAEKKYFNILWLKVLAGIIIAIISQVIVGVILSIVSPELAADPTIAIVSTMAPLFFIGYPIFILIMRTIPVSMEIEKKKMKFWHFFLAIILTFGMLWISNLVGTVITSMISKLIGKEVSVVLDTLFAAGGNIIVLTIIVSLLAPIFEEYIFRKILIDRIVGYGEIPAIFLSAFVFALFHGNLGQGIYAFTIGLIFGYVYIRTGKIQYTMILHMAVNFLGSVVPLIMRQFLDINEITLLSSSGDVEGLMSYFMSHIPGMLMLVFQECVVFGSIFGAIIILIVALCKKQFFIVKRESDIPKGKRFSVTFVNVGMLVLVVFCGIFFIAQLFGWQINLERIINVFN